MLHSIFKKQKTLYNISCARAVAQTASPLSCLCEHEQKLTVGVWKLQEEKNQWGKQRVWKRGWVDL